MIKELGASKIQKPPTAQLGLMSNTILFEKVGLPAKSGVSGIVLVVVPNVVGFALYSPPLDEIGNSARFFTNIIELYSNKIS